MTDRPDLADVIAAEFERELAREYILQRHDSIDEIRFEEACAVGKGNWVDIGVLYDLIYHSSTYLARHPDVQR